MATATAPIDHQARTRWAKARGIIFAVLCVGIALTAALPYFVASLTTLAENGAGLAEHFLDQTDTVRAALYVHAGLGGIALLLTPVQVSTRVRRNRMQLHRTVGLISTICIVISALGGLVLAPSSFAGTQGPIGFSLLSLIWMGTAIVGTVAATRGRLDLHRRLIPYTVACTCAAVTLRLWLGVFVASGMSFDDAYQLVPFLCWVPNVLGVLAWDMRRQAALASA